MSSLKITYDIHLNTKSTTFLDMYKYLKLRGVKNNKFFLRIYDSTLMNIDPHDENLTADQKASILTECIRNPWYYLREVVRIEVPGGTKRFEIHAGSLSLIFCILNNINVIEILPRQNGKTITTVSILSWIYNFGTTNTKAIFSNKVYDDSKLNLKRFKTIEDNLPQWLLSKARGDVNNIENIFNYSSKNSINTLPTGKSKTDADKLGRGLTVPIMWFDEFAFISYINEMYESASLALSQAAIEAEAMGKPHCKIITTTPNNIDVPEGKYCKAMINDAAPYIDAIYDMSYDKLQEYIESNSQNDFIYLEFSWKELGRTKKWFDSQCRAVNNVSLKIKRELNLEWTLSSDKSPFTEEQMEGVNNFKSSVIGSLPLLSGRYHIKFIEPFDPEARYFLGIDSSGGLQKDSSAIVIVDPNIGSPIGYFANNKIDTDEFFNLVCELAWVAFPNSILIPERNSMGIALVQRLLKTNLKSRLYYSRPEDKGERHDNEKSSSNEKRIYGVNTTGPSRELMIDLLFQMITDEPHSFKLPEICKEISTLEYKANGKIEHASGEHDDVLFSFLIVRYVMAFSTNLGTFLRGKKAGFLKNNEERTSLLEKTREEIVGNDPYNISIDKPVEKSSATRIFELNA